MYLGNNKVLVISAFAKDDPVFITPLKSSIEAKGKCSGFKCTYYISPNFFSYYLAQAPLKDSDVVDSQYVDSSGYNLKCGCFAAPDDLKETYYYAFSIEVATGKVLSFYNWMGAF